MLANVTFEQFNRFLIANSPLNASRDKTAKCVDLVSQKCDKDSSSHHLIICIVQILELTEFPIQFYAVFSKTLPLNSSLLEWLIFGIQNMIGKIRRFYQIQV